MKSKKEELISTAKLLWLALGSGVIVLSIESLLTKSAIFKNFALGLISLGLLLISLITALIIKSD